MRYYKDKLFDEDTIKHLRLPFSIFLLPVFLFAISQVQFINLWNSVIVFISLHFFIYPASNIYNSYMDNDTGSIGGLKNPPPVTQKLYIASIIFDGIGLALSLIANINLFLLMIIYIAVSKAYSWNKIRLKKYAILSWVIVMIFQGAYTYLLANMSASNNFTLDWFTTKNIYAMLLSALLTGGLYPITQIYQHIEDLTRGDKTISLILGVRGTFLLTAIVFLASNAFAYIYFLKFYNLTYFAVFMICLLPVACYFILWVKKCWSKPELADYSHTMRMITLSSCCMILCFVILYYFNHPK